MLYLIIKKYLVSLFKNDLLKRLYIVNQTLNAMKTFKELAANVAISKQLDRRDLPTDLKEYLNKCEYDAYLNKLKYEEKEGRDDLGYPDNNIIIMLDGKAHLARNIRSYERHNGGNDGSIWFPKVRYVLYYLEQEPNYVERYPQKTNLKRCDFNCHCHHCSGARTQNIYFIFDFNQI
jgi:hypothetical protein